MTKQLGPTGRFPDGRLDEADKGEFVMCVNTCDGRILLNFGAPVNRIGFDLNGALKFHRILGRHIDALRAERDADAIVAGD